MKRFILLTCCLVVCLSATQAEAVNSIVVESRNFLASQAVCSVGVFITNDIDIQGLTCPLELRTVDGGAFMVTGAGTTFGWGFPATGPRRLSLSPLGPANPAGCADDGDNSDCVWPGASITNNRYANPAATNTCSGPTSSTFQTIAAVDNVSPNAVFMATVSTGDEAVGHLIALEPGADAAGTPNASLLLRFTANANNGCMRIDSCCVTPANHVGFVNLSNQFVTPEFTAGDIVIGTGSCGGADVTPPTITCPGPVAVQCAADVPAANVGSVTTSDDVDPTPTVTHQGDGGLVGGPCGGTITRTYRSTDDAGNFAECTQIITVNDTQDPTITCPGPISVQCLADVPAANNGLVTASDNCDLSLTITNSTGSLVGDACGGTMTRTYTATDDCGNSASCTQTITVDDTQNPSITCPAAISVECLSDVPAPNPASVTASDNCDLNLTITSSDGSLVGNACGGTITRTYTATDDCGNSASCTQTITVDDTQSPIISLCQGDTLVLVPSGTPSAVVNYPAPVASDNCDQSLTVVCAPASGSSFAVGVTPVRCIVSDDCGNADTCDFNVTVQQEAADEPPVAQCQNLELNADASCQANGSINLNSFDPDGGAVTLSQSPAGPYGLGLTNVTLIVTDDEGDADTCQGTVTVNDVTDPVVTCPANIVVNTDSDSCSAIVLFAPTATDNCDANVEVVAVPVSGLSFPKGLTMVTVTATDDAGNNSQCQFSVTVNDAQPPSITCPSDIVTGNDPDQCGANMSYSAPTISDNCPGASVSCVPASGSFFGIGTTGVTCTVTDASGNTAQCQFDVTVNDTEDPTITCPSDISVTADLGQSSAVVNFSVTGSDNCPGITVVCVPSSGSAFPIGTTPVQCTATDAAGNTAQCGFNVTVNPSQEAAGPRADVDTVQFTADSESDCDTTAVNVTWSGDGGTAFLVSEAIDWLVAEPTSGNAPATIDLIACAAGLAPGNYEGVVHFLPDGTKGAGAPDSITVIYSVGCTTPSVAAEPDTVYLSYPDGQDCGEIQLISNGCGETCWQLLPGLTSDWLNVEPTSGSTPQSIQVCARPCDLQAGDYYDSLFFCPCEGKLAATVGCDIVVVKLTVTNPPVLSVNPLNLSFNLNCDGPYLPLPISIMNDGGGSLDWHAASGANWLVVDPVDGSTNASAWVSIDWNYIDCHDTCYTLRDSIRIYADQECALGSPQWVHVSLRVCPPGEPVCDSICGVVSDANCFAAGGGCPIENAVVELWDSYPDGAVQASAVTDANGQFCFYNTLGLYDLRAYREGYCTDVALDVVCEDYPITIPLSPFSFELPESPFFHDLYSVNATSHGYPILPGDVITACDAGGAIIGLAYVTQPGSYLIHVLGNVAATPDTVDEGADVGEQFTLWLNCDCPVDAPVGWANYGNTQFDAAWGCEPAGICCELCEGWSMFSYNLALGLYSRENVLATIDGHYDAIRSGRCEESGPNQVISWFDGRPINDLTLMPPNFGYDIHMTGSDTLCLDGQSIAPETPLYLCEGWNYIPYFPHEADGRTHALASIEGSYVHIFNLWCGQAGSWNSDRPEFLNDLYCLQPCHGYWIKLMREDTLIYPSGGYECSEPLAKVIANSLNGRVKGSPLFADFYSTANSGVSGLAQGDIITVRTASGVVAGEGVVGSNGSFLIHVYGDVANTPEIEGALEGETLNFEVNGASASVSGNANWSDRGNYEVTLSISGASTVPTDYALMQNYPNPFNAGTVIPFTLKNSSEWTLTVYNVMGQSVQTFSGYDDAGTMVRVEWNGLDQSGRHAPSGVYFYRVSTPAWTSSKKMTLLK